MNRRTFLAAPLLLAAGCVKRDSRVVVYCAQDREFAERLVRGVAADIAFICVLSLRNINVKVCMTGLAASRSRQPRATNLRRRLHHELEISEPCFTSRAGQAGS